MHIFTATIDQQQGPTTQHRELFSISYPKLSWEGKFKKRIRGCNIFIRLNEPIFSSKSSYSTKHTSFLTSPRISGLNISIHLFFFFLFLTNLVFSKDPFIQKDRPFGRYFLFPYKPPRFRANKQMITYQITLLQVALQIFFSPQR